MHRKRRLREPVKIHRRRQDCVGQECAFPVRLYKRSSQAFLRRFPWPQGWRSRGTRDPTGRRFRRNRPTAREICAAAASWDCARFALAHVLYQKIRPAGEKIRTRKLGRGYSTRRPVRALSTGNSPYAFLHAGNDIKSDSFSPFLFHGGTPAYKKESHWRQTFDSGNAKFLVLQRI